MDSIRDIFCIGLGPSSSHTMGPRKAAEAFLQSTPDAKAYRVTLYGSLSATGKGHLTDKAILDALAPTPTELIWSEESLPEHPNGMCFQALDENGKNQLETIFYSPGGGAIYKSGETRRNRHALYEINTMDDLLAWCRKTSEPMWRYVEICEGPTIWEHLERVWNVMKAAIDRGIRCDGVLPGKLRLQRKARSYHQKAKRATAGFRRTGLVASYALAVSEENAGGGIISTAPTCGACGVVPATLFYLQQTQNFEDDEILRGLAIAGLIGNFTKFNASISGAEVGCQGEVGTACAMASGAAAFLQGATNMQIEYAAEMGMEHHLGLTCDPIAGLVQIPCIERNSIAATRALDCADFALLSDGSHRITFDEVIETMYQTGLDMNSTYRETSLGGLARFSKQSKLEDEG